MRWIVSFMVALMACATTKTTKSIAAPPTVKIATPELTARTVEPLRWKTTYLVNSDGAFQCECATNATGKTLCKDCKSQESAKATNPELQEKLAAEYRTYQCLVRMGPDRMRTDPHTSAPGQVQNHQRPDGQPYTEYHYYYNRDTFQHFVCPLKVPVRKCFEEAGATADFSDEQCVLYAECLEVCRDPHGDIW